MDDGTLAVDAGVSIAMIPTYGITRGIDVPVSHRYQSVPELTKKAPARNLRTSLNMIRNIESRECVEHNEDDEPGRQCRNGPDR